MTGTWTYVWPTEPGFYWLYGVLFKPWQGKPDPPAFHYVKVHKIGGGGLAYVTSGQFLYEGGGAEGIWQPVVFPELPDVL